MSTEQTIQNADIKGTFAPHVVLAPADITIISHSNVFYWWPAWVMGFVSAAIQLSAGQGRCGRAGSSGTRAPEQ